LALAPWLAAYWLTGHRVILNAAGSPLPLGPKEAKEIADARIAVGDTGGFNYAGRSFFQLANEYIDATKIT
jgi:hypothetical protein